MKCKGSSEQPAPPAATTMISALSGVDANKLLPGVFPPFKLERYICKAFDTYPDLKALCSSDAQAWTLKEILDLATDEVREAWNSMSLAYQDPKGHPDLITEVAKLHGVGEDGVYIVVPRQGIYNTLSILVPYLRSLGVEEPHAVVGVPAFQITQETLVMQGCAVSEWHARDTPDGWQFFIEEFKALLQPNTKIVAVNFPHCPTGFIPSREDWLELINICKARDIFLFSDEMYNYMPLDGGQHLESACSLMDNAISLFGMSKTFGLSGLRLGWLCSRNTDIISMFKCYGDYLSLGCSASAQILALVALRRMNYTIGRNLQLGLKNLDILSDFISRHTDVMTWHRPTSGTTAYVRVEGWLMNSYGNGTAQGICDRLINEHQLLILPSFVYGVNDLYIRFGFIRFDFQENLQLFENILNAARPLCLSMSLKSLSDVTPRIIDVTNEYDDVPKTDDHNMAEECASDNSSQISDDSEDITSDDVTSDDITCSSGVSSGGEDLYMDTHHSDDVIGGQRKEELLI